MPSPLSAAEILERDFLEVRCRLLDIAASLDRMSDASGALPGDARIAQIREAIDVLGDDTSDRAGRVQMIFSDSFDDDWRQKYGV